MRSEPREGGPTEIAAVQAHKNLKKGKLPWLSFPISKDASDSFKFKVRACGPDIFQHDGEIECCDYALCVSP
jgi:hypothetical protein